MTTPNGLTNGQTVQKTAATTKASAATAKSSQMNTTDQDMIKFLEQRHPMSQFSTHFGWDQFGIALGLVMVICFMILLSLPIFKHLELI